jgi:hypothetical protein
MSDETCPESQLSPRFLDYLREKTTMNEDVHEITDTTNTRSNPDHTFDTIAYRHQLANEASANAKIPNTSDKFRGIKIAHTISPVDGKTNGCDRRHTFDNFVNQQQIRNELEPEKRVGHGWQVLRALKKAVRAPKKSRTKPSHGGAQAQQFST